MIRSKGLARISERQLEELEIQFDRLMSKSIKMFGR